jgi:hypothetical protein
VLHLAAIELCDIGVDVGELGFTRAEPCLDLGLLPLELRQPSLHGRLVQTVFDGSDDPGDRPLDLGQCLAVGFRLGATCLVLAVHLLVVGAHGLGHGLRRDQPLGEPSEHPLFHEGALDRAAVGAGYAAVMVEAAVTLLGDDAVLAPAAAAHQQA